MAYNKGRKVETGIWRLADRKDLNLAEVSWKDQHTGQRVRQRKVLDKVKPLRDWRLAQKTDALRGEIRRDRKTKKDLPLDRFADECLYYRHFGDMLSRYWPEEFSF